MNISPDDLSLELATAAHAGISMVPERRGRQRQAEYVSHMERLRDTLQALAKTPAQEALLAEELARYKAGYLNRLRALLSAESRCMSTMITGGSNFPTHRNQKRNATADRRREELLEWSKRARHSICRKLSAARTPDQVQDQEAARLKKAVEGLIGTLYAIQTGENNYSNPALFKTGLAGKIKRSAANGNAIAVSRALKHLRELQAKWLKRPAYTDRHSIWKLEDAAGAAETRHDENVDREPETVGLYAGAEIVNDFADERIRIHFDEKPGEDVRHELKRSGWRWSPTNTAHQRKNTRNAIYSAREIVGRFFEEVTE